MRLMIFLFFITTLKKGPCAGHTHTRHAWQRCLIFGKRTFSVGNWSVDVEK